MPRPAIGHPASRLSCLMRPSWLQCPAILTRRGSMPIGSMSTHRAPWLRAKHLVFGLIGLMFAYVLRHNEHFLIDSKDPFWPHIQSFKWWLLPHGLTGACALILGPMQFSDRLRKRFTKLHRVAGRFYVAGVFCAAPLGFYIQHFEERMG